MSPFKSLVIPDASKVESDYVDVLKSYVQNGGRLLVCGKPSSKLAELLGVTVVEEIKPEPAYIRIDNSILPTPPEMPLYSYKDMIAVRAESGTKTLAPLVWALNHGTPHFVSHRQSPAMDVDSPYAALTLRKVGKGAAVYSAAPLFDIYATMGYTEMRNIAKDLLDILIPPSERVADVEASAPLEISVNRQEDKVIIHLVHCPQSRRVNYSNNGQDYVRREPIIDGFTTISDAKLNLPASMVAGKTVRLAERGVKLRLSSAGGGVVTIRVPDFQISTVLVIE